MGGLLNVLYKQAYPTQFCLDVNIPLSCQYCFPHHTTPNLFLVQVVLQRNLPTPEAEPEQSPLSLDQDMVQIMQLVVVVVFIIAM